MSAIRNYMAGQYADVVEAQGDNITVIIELIIGVLLIIAMWKIFTKAGEAGWKSIIPIYNVYTLFKISMGAGWYVILLFIPLIRYIAYIMLAINLARCFEKSSLFAVGIFALPPIFLIILGFSDAQYVGPGGFGDYTSGNSFSTRTYESDTQTFYSNNSSDDSFDVDESEAQTVEFTVEEVDD